MGGRLILSVKRTGGGAVGCQGWSTNLELNDSERTRRKVLCQRSRPAHNPFIRKRFLLIPMTFCKPRRCSNWVVLSNICLRYFPILFLLVYMFIVFLSGFRGGAHAVKLVGGFLYVHAFCAQLSNTNCKQVSSVCKKHNFVKHFANLIKREVFRAQRCKIRIPDVNVL